MSYATEWADAYADILDAGSAITFTKTSYPQDDTTGAVGAAVTAMASGVAIRVHGDPILYRELGLTLTESPTLLFAPGTMGTLPALDAVGSWGAVPYHVKHVKPLDVDGAGAILARVVVVRA